MSIHDLPPQFSLPELHKSLTPLPVSIEGYVRFNRDLGDSLTELEKNFPAVARPSLRSYRPVMSVNVLKGT